MTIAEKLANAIEDSKKTICEIVKFILDANLSVCTMLYDNGEANDSYQFLDSSILEIDWNTKKVYVC